MVFMIGQQRQEVGRIPLKILILSSALLPREMNNTGQCNGAIIRIVMRDEVMWQGVLGRPRG